MTKKRRSLVQLLHLQLSRSRLDGILISTDRSTLFKQSCVGDLKFILLTHFNFKAFSLLKLCFFLNLSEVSVGAENIRAQIGTLIFAYSWLAVSTILCSLTLVCGLFAIFWILWCLLFWSLKRISDILSYLNFYYSASMGHWICTSSGLKLLRISDGFYGMLKFVLVLFRVKLFEGAMSIELIWCTNGRLLWLLTTNVFIFISDQGWFILSLRFLPIAITFLKLECFLDIWEAWAHLLQLLTVVSVWLHQQVLELHFFATLLFFLFCGALRLVPTSFYWLWVKKITDDFLLLFAQDVMEFELLVTVLLTCLDSVEASSEVQIQLIRCILVLKHPAEEVDAFDAPYNAGLGSTTDRIWGFWWLIVLELLGNLRIFLFWGLTGLLYLRSCEFLFFLQLSIMDFYKATLAKELSYAKDADNILPNMDLSLGEASLGCDSANFFVEDASYASFGLFALK